MKSRQSSYVVVSSEHEGVGGDGYRTSNTSGHSKLGRVYKVKISKWYHVLVVGGASILSTGCGGAESQSMDVGPADPQDMTAGQVDQSSEDAAPPTGDAASSIDAQTSVDASQVQDASISIDALLVDAAQPDAAAIECSAQPNPSDACGCPCCWAVGFLNTDPECEGFCTAGNGGAGCCGD